jgi:hypothetical protein
MNEKKLVRLRPDSPLTSRLNLPAGAIGTVICQYRVLRESEAAPVRVDVRFDDCNVIWGVPEKEFEVVFPFNAA